VCSATSFVSSRSSTKTTYTAVLPQSSGEQIENDSGLESSPKVLRAGNGSTLPPAGHAV
jgi:hypothetical protein